MDEIREIFTKAEVIATQIGSRFMVMKEEQKPWPLGREHVDPQEMWPREVY